MTPVGYVFISRTLTEVPDFEGICVIFESLFSPHRLLPCPSGSHKADGHVCENK